MVVTKNYLFILMFESGSATCEEFYKESLRQAAWRADMIPGHRIEIATYEDSTDEREIGMAANRLEVLREYFLAQGIAEDRIETQRCSEEHCGENLGSFDRRAEIHLFPRVASLCSEIGDPFLGHRELSLLQTARLAVIFNESAQHQIIDELGNDYDWRRIVGHQSLEAWAAAGARHPLYDRIGS